MEEQKKTYYISVGNGEIFQSAEASPWEFKISASLDEITELRECFDLLNQSSWEGFFRAHVPYLEYHYDRPNDTVDKMNAKVYRMIYELGDEEAKEHIVSQEILKNIEEQQ
ncbi:hydrolase [Metabacillus sp. GX 13764]|uniref:hydrolase n=1 Tax=Metabacillus kandeliae TaxID=2900151 RepID=UPI001E2F5F23|nr:hydrolase [Metabacillus kandeliae]MCD7032625.1 hydrolase [Metabacillus kandeliae]